MPGRPSTRGEPEATPLGYKGAHRRDAGGSQLSTSFTWCCSSSCRQVGQQVGPVQQAKSLCTFGKAQTWEVSSAQLSQPQPVSERSLLSTACVDSQVYIGRWYGPRGAVKQ